MAEKPLVRIFSPFFPYPPTEGATQVIFSQVIEFIQTHRVQLVCWKDHEEVAKTRLQLPWIERFPPEVELIFLETKTEKGKFGRVARIAKSLIGKYASVEEFYFPDLIETPEFERADLEIFHYSLCLKWLKIPGRSNSAKRVSHFLNIEADLFNQRAVAEQNLLRRLILQRFTKQLRRNELAVAELVNECWMLSQVDFDHIVKCGISNAVLRPLVFSQAFEQTRRDLRASRPPSNAPFSVGIIGGLEFKPNIDSALFVLDHLCLEIQKRKLDCQVTIVGKNPPPYIIEKSRAFPFVKVLGFVESLETFWRDIDCMVVPQLSGSGVRIKLMEAIASGVPTIANPEACAPLSETVRNSTYLHITQLNEFGKKLAELIKTKDSTQSPTGQASLPIT